LPELIQTQDERKGYGKKITISGAQYINTNIYRIIKKEPRERKDLVGYIGNLGPRKGVLAGKNPAWLTSVMPQYPHELEWSSPQNEQN